MGNIEAQVIDQLRAMARARLASQRPGHTLQPTALVAEAWLKLRNHFDAPEPTPAFYKVASEAMRQILIDHARAKATLKRGGGRRVDHDVGLVADREIDDQADPDQLLALDAAIAKLEQLDPQAAAVVKLRFFTGLPVEQAAGVLGVSERTVKRDWQFARTWLAKELGEAAS
jgi:RNA polymerase sigma-70 factor, ECF subfamily